MAQLSQLLDNTALNTESLRFNYFYQAALALTVDSLKRGAIIPSVHTDH